MCLCRADVDSESIIKRTKCAYQSTFVHFIIFYYYHSPPKCTYFRMCVSFFLFYYCESHVLRSVLFFSILFVFSSMYESTAIHCPMIHHHPMIHSYNECIVF